MTTADPTQRLYVEFDGAEDCPVAFGGDSSVVLYFVSWAYSLRFGAQHELSLAAMRMQRRHKVELRPLLRYADQDVEDATDQHELDHAWQDAAPLAECCRAVIAAIAADDEELDGLLEGYDDLAPRLGELAAMCDWGADAGARVRLSFDLRSPDGE